MWANDTALMIDKPDYKHLLKRNIIEVYFKVSMLNMDYNYIIILLFVAFILTK